ncbi:aminoglycoside phosphotransferase family protein [Paenibacillus hemerocallicola]|uniref:Aminoglycoside phosphotransferase family protein n=1 Tax=Paenibacillus hemerocallicola TaxID=1172614 RepID=A0A5C4T0M5_9BACL|nr:aminoglycoside phosphotransferase family protein [Paenibacillus hemerocallicola]TNJ62496.1 aminoglycoside phosphotransferase family protein [Paenibacillus hemerocallicola]
MNHLKTVLKDHYDIVMTNVSPQQGGWAALAYKVFDGNHAYFLKVYEKSRASTPKWTALIDKYVPILVWLLHNSGLTNKIPVPLPTKNGEYKCEDEHGIYLLYEYIDGETIGDKNLTADQVCQLADIITELHSYGEKLPLETDSIEENYDVPYCLQLSDLLDKDYRDLPDELKKAIHPHLKQLKDLVHTIEELSARLKKSNLKMALCHTDIHNWNLMQSDRQLILIDWEGLRLAPVEADLMFLVDKPYYEEFATLYRKSHKNFEINPDALQFYKGRRELEDIWEFIEQLLFDKQDDHQRAGTLKSLKETLTLLS